MQVMDCDGYLFPPWEKGQLGEMLTDTCKYFPDAFSLPGLSGF